MKIHKDDNPKEFLNAGPSEVKCPESIIRKKKEKLMDLECVINEICAFSTAFVSVLLVAGVN